MSVLKATKAISSSVTRLGQRVSARGIDLPEDARRRVPRLTTGDNVPLHPALTDLPVATLSLAPIMDALGLAGSESAGGAGLWMGIAGVASAVPTAAAGVLDYLRAGTGTEVQRLGLRHGLLNSAALGLAIGSMVARRLKSKPTLLSTLLSASSGLVVTYSSHLGGIMVYREGMRVEATARPEVGTSGEGRPVQDTTATTELYDIEESPLPGVEMPAEPETRVLEGEGQSADAA